MKNPSFEFKGDWELELKLEKFKILNNSEYTRGSEKPSQGFFKFEIFDEFNSNPDPENYQINAINFLLNPDNQSKVLTSLLKYSRDIIYPHYKTFMWESEYPECYPELNKVEDLNKLYGINRIVIKRIGHEDFAYYIFDCSSCLDYEHGITVTLYKDTVIDHGEDWDDKKVCEHKGIDYNSYHEKAVKDYNHREVILIKPHEKYGKLKPWQKYQNEWYPVGLYHANRLGDFKKALETGEIPKEPTISKILYLSIFHKKEEFTQFLIDQNVDYKNSAFKEALNRDRYDLTDKLLQQGYNINEKVAQSSLFYETISYLIKAIADNKEIDKYTKRLKYLLNNGFDPYLEDNFNRNSLCGIERIDDKILKKKVQIQITKILSNKKSLLNTIKGMINKRKSD